MTLKCYSPGNKPLGFLNNVFDLKITKEIGGMEELTFFIPANSPEAKMIQLEGYIVPEGEQIFVIRELNTHGKDIEVYCMLAIETLYGYCWSEVAKQGVNLIEAFEYVLKYTGWKFVNKTSTPARTRDIYIQNQTVWEALKVLCEVYFIEMTVDTHTHTITAYDSVGQDNGVFFISDMNLVNFRKDTNTHKLITRLIPIGKDGLNITSVNGGKDYIDNNTYSDKLLYGLWMQSAYTNPTQLKEDATKWLAEYAKPYITYNIDIIDLYRLNGNQLFKFNVGDGVTIFDKVTEEKVSQRVVKIEIYPQDPTRNTVELSNKGKTFSDYFQMIQLMQNMANHFIQTNGSATGTGGTNGSANATVQEGSIGSGHIKADSINAGHLQAGSVTTDKLTANSITTDKLVANSVTADKLTANSITSDKIQANSIKTEHLQANIIDSNKIFAGAVTTDKLQAGSVTADKIASNSISTDKLQANSITSDKIKANNITTNHLQASAITSDKIGANAIEAKHIKAGVVDSQHISSESIKTEHLQAGSITANKLQTGSITAEKIQTGAITAGSGIIANGAIGDAQISSVNANKINAGEIDTSKVKVKGSNGYLFIENNTLFVVDNKKQIRCELGVIENNSNYGFIVRGSDGKTILIDHNGVHNAGITDGAIDNRKVSENANISGKKLDIDSVIRTINEDGAVSIQGTKVQVGNTTLDVELSKQTNLINNHTTQLNNQQSSINANTNAIKLKVDSQTYTADKNNMTTQMNKNTSAISVLEKEIDLKVEQSDITTAVNNVNKTIDTKISTAKSEIKATTDSITQSVSSVQSTTSKLQTDLNKLEVGGRNFVLNSGFSGCVPNTQNIPKWITWGSNIKVFSNQGTSNYNEPNTVYLANGATSAEGIYQIVNASVIPPNTEITISGRLTKENNVIDTRLDIEYYDANNTILNIVTLGSGEIKKTITTISNYTNFRLVVHHKGSSSSSGGYLIRVSNIKIEKGNKATSWTPAIEDVQSQLDSNASEISTTKSKMATIETNLNGITQKVSSVESTTTKLNTTTTNLQNSLNTTNTTLNNTTSKLNNLTVGGKNLISNSAPTNLTGWEKSTGWNLSLVGCTNAPYGKATRATATVAGATGGVHKQIVSKDKLVDGAEYTVSAWVRASKQMNINFRQETMNTGNWVTINTSWKYITFTKTITKSYQYHSNTFYVSADSNIAVGDWFEVHSLKLERGNKATDWSPSPDEVQDQLNTNTVEINNTKSKVATVETNLSGITSRVSNVETKTTNIDGRVTSQEARIQTAESKITANAIINTVSSTIDSKVNTGINDIQVGGRNLFLNSGFTEGTNYWYIYNCTGFTTVADASALSGYVAKFTSTGGGIYQRKGGTSSATSTYPKGTKLIVSGYVKSSVAGKSMRVSYEGANGDKITTCTNKDTWYSFTHAVTLSADWHTLTFYADSGADYYLKDVMFEYGTKATTWTPAPEDIENKVDSQYSELKQTANSITATVSDLNGKYTQIKQTVDNIDLTGKVSFSDLSTAGKTTINGANITTGTLSADRILGGTLKGVSLQTYSGTNTSGVRIHPGGMQLNDTSFFYNNEGKFELQCKQGVAFSSQKDIHIMPGLLASGTPSGNGTVVIPSATLRTQKLYVVNNATFESGLTTSNLLSNGVIYGRNNITLNRGSVYIPRLNSNITTDYLRLGGAYISGADSGAIHFNYASSRSGALGRGTVYLPSGGGNNTTDHLAFHSGIIACVDSGNFHFITAGGGNSTIYPRGVVATYSLDNVARTRTTSKALDIVSSVPVTQTVEGFRLDVPKARTTENEQLITTSENEQTGELDISTNYNSMLGTMWKAIQELQQEVKELKEENEELKTLLNKGE